MFEIETKLLNAIHQFSAKEDVRYYLKGVLLDLDKGVLRLVASCGAVLGVCRLVDEYQDMPDGQWIMPTAMVEAILKLKVPRVEVVVRDTPDGKSSNGNALNDKPTVCATHTLSVISGGQQLIFDAIAGRYPDW